MKDERPLSNQGIARLDLVSARLSNLDDDQIIIQIDVLGQGPLWIQNAHFILIGKATNRVDAPRRVKLKVERGSIRFSTRRRFFTGRKHFTLNPMFTLDPHPHVSLPVHYTQEGPQPLHLDPIQASIILPSYLLEALRHYQPVLLNPHQRSLTPPRHHLSPDLITIQPKFRRKAPSND